LHDIPITACEWHEHGVDVYLLKKGCRCGNGGWEADLDRLAELALVTCLHVPLDIGFESWPPKAVEQGVLRGVKALVAKAVMGVAYQGVMSKRRNIELVAATGLSSPKPAACEEEAVRSANEMSEHMAVQVRRSAPQDEVLLDGVNVLVAARELDQCQVVIHRHVWCWVDDVVLIGTVGVVIIEVGVAEVGAAAVVVVEGGTVDVFFHVLNRS
jgi:hypothetical protein